MKNSLREMICVGGALPGVTGNGANHIKGVWKNMENRNLNELMREYQKAAHGEAKISAMKAAVRQADLEKDIRNQLQIRLDLVEESIFYGDTMDALVTFPQLLAMEEENSDFVDTYDVLWAFKWILTGATDFPQISLKEIDSYLGEYKKRCKENGYSLRSYYHKKRSVYQDIDEEKAKEANWKMQMCRQDYLCDCKACELNAQVDYDLRTGQVDKAFEEVKPILNHLLACAEVPGQTYCTLMTYFCKQRHRKKSKKYFDLLYPIVFKRKAMGLTGETAGEMLYYCSLYDRAQGIEIFQKLIKEELDVRNPRYKMLFAKGAYQLFHALQEEREFINISLPQIPVEKTKDGYSVAELAEMYYHEYVEIAKRFDERNGNTYYMEQIK